MIRFLTTLPLTRKVQVTLLAIAIPVGILLPLIADNFIDSSSKSSRFGSIAIP